MEVCDICGARVQLGPHVYGGKRIPRYQITICQDCWNENQDGYGPAVEEKFLAHLKALGIPEPARNAKGWFPRE